MYLMLCETVCPLPFKSNSNKGKANQRVCHRPNVSRIAYKNHSLSYCCNEMTLFRAIKKYFTECLNRNMH